MTKEEIEAVLADINTRLELQGRIVDERLLQKKRQVEKLLQEYDLTNASEPNI